MNNIIKLALSILVVVSLSGCNAPTHDVLLVNGDSAHTEFTDTKLDTVIELPILEEEGMIFVGWYDNESYYYDSFKVKANVTLRAVFEDPKEVFVLLDDPIIPAGEAIIESYIGDATHLQIPQIIDQMLVTSILSKAFEESNLIEVGLPRNIQVQRDAFLNSTSLKKVYVYGNHPTSHQMTLDGIEYRAILEEYSSVCTIVDGSEEDPSWMFSTNCPIALVHSVQTMNIGGNIFSMYDVEMDPDVYLIHSNNLYSMSGSFTGATALETITIPKEQYGIITEMFTGCPNLQNIIIEEANTFFSSENGILYNLEKTSLVYYPPGLDETEYVVPNNITEIGRNAFYQNTILEKIIIHDNVDYIGDFRGLSGLKEIIVDENNENYKSIDGVLFEGNDLVKYPALKTGITYTVPEETEILRIFSFEFNKNLVEVVFNSDLEVIGNLSFSNSMKIKKLEVPASVTFLGNSFFEDSAIETVILERSYITDGSIVYTGGIGAFDQDVKIFVPDDSIEAYFQDLMWERYGNNVYSMSEYNGD